MSVAAKLQNFLDVNRTPYHVLKHHERYTALEIAAALHVAGRDLAKVVVVKADGRYAMAVLPAPWKVDLDQLARAMGVGRVELAKEEEMRDLFRDCEVGAEPPFGNLYGLPVYVDRTLTEDQDIFFEAGSHKEAIKMAYADFERLVHPRVGSFGMLA
jgi:Ala-tRNA(Pro) deacylase